MVAATGGFLQKIIEFWDRYENLNLRIAFILMSLQLVHIYWLTTDIVINRVSGHEILHGISSASGSQDQIFLLFMVAIDYIEVPAIVAGSTYYLLSILKYRKRKTVAAKNTLFLAMLAAQMLHIFWLTDEIVHNMVEFSYYAAWIAIVIDYLELPVIADFFFKTFVKRRVTIAAHSAGDES